jgi:hypothetical protein
MALFHKHKERSWTEVVTAISNASTNETTGYFNEGTIRHGYESWYSNEKDEYCVVLQAGEERLWTIAPPVLVGRWQKWFDAMRRRHGVPLGTIRVRYRLLPCVLPVETSTEQASLRWMPLCLSYTVCINMSTFIEEAHALFGEETLRILLCPQRYYAASLDKSVGYKYVFAPPFHTLSQLRKQTLKIQKTLQGLSPNLAVHLTSLSRPPSYQIDDIVSSSCRQRQTNVIIQCHCLTLDMVIKEETEDITDRYLRLLNHRTPGPETLLEGMARLALSPLQHRCWPVEEKMKTLWKPATPEDQHRRSEEYYCSICLGTFQKKDRVYTQCGHVFCLFCIESHIMTALIREEMAQCPLCRRPIEGESLRLCTASVSSSRTTRLAETMRQMPVREKVCVCLFWPDLIEEARLLTQTSAHISFFCTDTRCLLQNATDMPPQGTAHIVFPYPCTGSPFEMDHAHIVDTLTMDNNNVTVHYFIHMEADKTREKELYQHQVDRLRQHFDNAQKKWPSHTP